MFSDFLSLLLQMNRDSRSAVRGFIKENSDGLEALILAMKHMKRMLKSIPSTGEYYMLDTKTGVLYLDNSGNIERSGSNLYYKFGSNAVKLSGVYESKVSGRIEYNYATIVIIPKILVEVAQEYLIKGCCSCALRGVYCGVNFKGKVFPIKSRFNNIVRVQSQDGTEAQLDILRADVFEFVHSDNSLDGVMRSKKSSGVFKVSGGYNDMDFDGLFEKYCVRVNGGTLRLKYFDFMHLVVDLARASSGRLRGVGDEPSKSNRKEWFNWVNRVFRLFVDDYSRGGSFVYDYKNRKLYICVYDSVRDWIVVSDDCSRIGYTVESKNEAVESFAVELTDNSCFVPETMINYSVHEVGHWLVDMLRRAYKGGKLTLDITLKYINQKKSESVSIPIDYKFVSNEGWCMTFKGSEKEISIPFLGLYEVSVK